MVAGPVQQLPTEVPAFSDLILFDLPEYHHTCITSKSILNLSPNLSVSLLVYLFGLYSLASGISHQPQSPKVFNISADVNSAILVTASSI